VADRSRFIALAGGSFDRLVDQARGDPHRLAALAGMALWSGHEARAYELAREARALAPDDAELRSKTQRPLTDKVPKWHFSIVRDEARNRAYDEALRRAVGPETRVLDIGAGTGLLAMMAARAGAGTVVSCEMNPAVADAAREIVALNGFADRLTVVAKASNDVDPEADMGGRADLLVQEIVANDLVGEYALPAIEDAARRLLKPGARMIPSGGAAVVALAFWPGLEAARLRDVDGFDVSPFNRLAHVPYHLKAGDPQLALRSDAAVLFDFDFASGGPFPAERTSVELTAQGPANGVAQWIRLQMDAEGVYENRPAPGLQSCWAILFTPLDPAREAAAGERVVVHASHDTGRLRVWAS
jgi:type II protein arginine methyltransferase